MIKSKSYLAKLPTELLFIIFREFDIPTLLNVCNVCRRFQQIGTKVLSKKFKEMKIELVLTFEQEYKWRFNVQFELSEFNEQSGKFVFKPKSNQPMRFIYSPMVRSPVLSKASFTGISGNNSGNTHVPPTPSTSISFPFLFTSLSPSNSLISVRRFGENFLQKSLTLNISPCKDTFKKDHYVLRIGHGTLHLRIPYTFRYSISDALLPSMQKTCDRERWLTPLSFECDPSFFYLREPTAHKIIMNMIHMNMIHLKKMYLRKKKSSSTPNHNYERGQNINFERVDDLTPIKLITKNNTSCERQMNEKESLSLFSTKKLKSALVNRWTNGARR